MGRKEMIVFYSSSSTWTVWNNCNYEELMIDWFLCSLTALRKKPEVSRIPTKGMLWKSEGLLGRV
jgi:hypothetical protein